MTETTHSSQELQEDFWKTDIKLLSNVWRASIRVRLVLAENEISSLNYSYYYEVKKNMQNRDYIHPILDKPYGIDLLVGRNAYLLEASKEIIDHFQSFSIEYLDVIRLTYNQITLNLSLPIGVLYDVYCCNEDIMEITVHFQTRISTSSTISSPSFSSTSTITSPLPPATSSTQGRKSQNFPSIPYGVYPDWTRKMYLHSVKQAYNLLTNSNMQLIKPETQQLLFNSCQISELKTFLSIFDTFFPHPSLSSDETRRAIPIRVIKKDLSTNNLFLIQKYISKVVYTQDLTLEAILEKHFNIVNIQDKSVENKRFLLSQGISLVSLLRYPVQFIWSHLMSGDFFLYIVVNDCENGEK